MLLRAVEIGEPGVRGRLWLSSMPGRFEPFERFLDEATGAGISLTLCLTPRHEVAHYAPAYHAAIESGALPFRWLNLPMRDFGLAGHDSAFRSGIETACRALQDGDAVLLHCAAGIGRTGTAAACLLKHLGLPTARALRQVREAGSNPESALQSGLVETF